MVKVGEPPAKLTLNKSEVKPGDIVDLVLAGNDGETFKGFIIQARDANRIQEQVGRIYFKLGILQGYRNR